MTAVIDISYLALLVLNCVRELFRVLPVVACHKQMGSILVCLLMKSIALVQKKNVFSLTAHEKGVTRKPEAATH